MKRDEQIWAQWFDEDGNGPQVTIVNGEWCGTPLHIEWQVNCLDPLACIASVAFGGVYMRTDAARELASRLVEAADLADAEWRRMEAAGEPLDDRYGRGYVGANTVKSVPRDS